MNRIRKYVLIILLPAALFLSGFSTPLEKEWDRFHQANTLYQNGQFAQAAEQYKSLIQAGVDNGHLYYNLGNTYYRLGQYGPAVLSFLRAKFHLPRNEEVEANLLFAIRETQDKLDWQREGGSGSFFFWIAGLTLKEHLFILLGLNLVFWFLQAIQILRPSWGTSMARSVALALLGFMVLSTALRWHYDTQWDYGVVMANRIEVLSGPEKNNSVLFHLHEGAIVTVSDENGPWKQIQLPDGTKGWVRAPGQELQMAF